MKISSVELKNVQGITTKVNLWPVSVITGDNFAGKSVIAKAIRLALTGGLPPSPGKTEPRKSAQSIYKMAGNSEVDGSMAIALSFDNGRRVDWTWTKKDGSVKTDGGVPRDLMLPELLTSPSRFWSLTEQQRTEIVFGACATGTFGPDTIINRLAEINAHPVTVCVECQEGIAAMVRDKFQSAGVALAPALIIQQLTALAKTSADLAKRDSGAFAAFAAAGARPQDVSKELDKAKAAAAMLRTTAGMDVGEKRGRLEACKKQLRKLFDSVVPGCVQSQVGMLIDTLKAELAATVRPQTPPAFEVPPVNDDLLESYNRALQRNIEWAAAIKAKEDSIAKIATYGTTCPTCGNTSKGWKTKFRKQLERELKQDMEVFDCDKQKLESLTEELERRRSAAADRARYESECEQYEVAKASLEQRIETLEQTVESIAELDDEIARLTRELEATTDAPSAVQTADERVRELEQQQAEWNRYQAEIQRREQLEQSLLENQCRAEVYKAARKIVMEEQAKVTNSAFGDVLAVANRMTGGLLNSPLEFVDGELGRRVSEADKARSGASIGSWISHVDFSGTEELLAYAGFAIALASKAPFKLVIMDELGRLNAERKCALIARMAKCEKEGVIDQFIGIDVAKNGNGLQIEDCSE